jgi:hypothetical protein
MSLLAMTKSPTAQSDSSRATLYTHMGEKQLKKKERFRLPGTPQAHARSRGRAWLQTRPENPLACDGG